MRGGGGLERHVVAGGGEDAGAIGGHSRGMECAAESGSPGLSQDQISGSAAVYIRRTNVSVGDRER